MSYMQPISVKSASIFGVGSGAAQTLVAAVAGKRIRVHAFSMIGNGAASIIEFSDGSSLWRLGGGVQSNLGAAPAFIFQTAAGSPLNAIVDNGTVYLGGLSYSLVDG